jgi:hypothetical protein
MRLEQRLDGAVVLERGEPRREAIETALEKAGYRCLDEAAQTHVVDYREAATPSVTMTFRPVAGRFSWPVRDVVRSIRVWRSDARTMAYTVIVVPLWLLQAAGVAAAVVSIVAAAMTGEARTLAGLIVAGILLGMPKLWIDDVHHVVREALGELPPADPLVAPPRAVDPLEAPEPGEDAAPPARERVRIATDEPALAAAAQTARDAVARYETTDPVDAVEALERAARRGGQDD